MKYSRQETLEREAGNRLDERWEQWRKYLDPFSDKYREIKKDYECEQDSTENSRRRSKLKYPNLWTLFHTLFPISYDALTGEQPYIGAKARNQEDALPAKQIEDYQSYQLDQISFPLKYHAVEFDRLLYGTTYTFCPWLLEYSLRKREMPVQEVIVDPKTGLPQQITKLKKLEREVVTYDNIDVQRLDHSEIAYDPTITNPADLMWKGEGVIRQWRTTIEEIKAKAKRKRPDGSWTGLYSQENVDLCVNGYDDKKNEPESDDKDDQYSGKLLMREGWQKLPVKKVSVKRKKNGEESEVEELEWDDEAPLRECLVTKCVTTGTVLRVILNPTDEQFRPFLASNCYPMPGRLPGMSWVRVIKGLDREAQIIKNARLDYINFVLNRPWVVNVHSGIQIRDSFNIPDRIIKARDINGIKPLDVPDYGSAAYRDLSMIDYEIQNASGVLNANQDASKFGQGFGETATGINYFQQLVGSRTKVVVQLAEYQWFVPLGKMLFCYGKQFVTKEESFRVLNSENPFAKMDPDSYTRMIDVIPVGAYSRVTKGQQITLLDRFLTTLPSLRDLIKVEEVIKDYIVLTKLSPDPSKYMISPEEQAQRAKMAQKPDVKPRVHVNIRGEDIPIDSRMELLMKEYGLTPKPIPNVLNPVGMPTMPTQLVNPQGMPTGV